MFTCGIQQKVITQKQVYSFLNPKASMSKGTKLGLHVGPRMCLPPANVD